MEQDTSRLAQDLRRNPALLRDIMDSRDGQALLRMLNGQGDFRHAVQSAAKGDTAEMTRRLQQITQSPDGAALLARIQRAVQS